MSDMDPYADVKQLLPRDPASAVAHLRRQAQLGDPHAQLALGQLLINGIGTRLDSVEALRWFHAAADVGVPMAMNMIGRCHEYGFGTVVNYPQAAYWYLYAAGLDCDWAMYNYAQLLAHGRGVTQDRATAFTWFRMAANRGHARAMNFLGLYYERGWGTPMDRYAAFDWYQKSAEGGDYRGQCSHASALAEQGHTDQALHWLRQAAAEAPPRFIAELATMLASSVHAELRAFAKALPPLPDPSTRERLRAARGGVSAWP
ncbi:tetratricopeptide repeat protein [Rhodanobacter sp. Si-c]|uniref:Tetratricopeptide repeat protein n=1 Tax=Rhodanobacter lycopersici TaxID=3162487 RepID=A0ABV3QEX2_9GAMM